MFLILQKCEFQINTSVVYQNACQLALDTKSFGKKRHRPQKVVKGGNCPTTDSSEKGVDVVGGLEETMVNMYIHGWSSMGKRQPNDTLLMI